MEGGIHIICINLKHRADRWKRFSEQPELQRLKDLYTFERYEAVNGSAINIQKDDRISLRTKRNIREHIRRDHEELDSAGGVGCYLSHVNVWRQFLERPEPFLIVFEDDADIPPGFTQQLHKAMQDATLLPQTPDLWFFSKPSEWYFNYKGMPNPYSVKEQNLGPWTTKTCASFTGYLLTKRGAERLLETAFPIDMHVDLYSCLVSDLGNILTVCHRDVIVKPLELKDMDTDIQVAKDCAICNIPTKFQTRGIIVVSIPTLIVSIGLVATLYYLGRGGPMARLRR